jgi:nucleotide-binding universal stress UspA family protein
MEAPGSQHEELERFKSWLGPELTEAPGLRPEVVVAFGVAGIEIGRLAGLRRASLVVLGRRRRAPDHRLLLGETADAVVRRCDTPVLFVPAEMRGIGRIMVALDASERAARVLEASLDVARQLGASVSAVTVELDGNEPRAGSGSPMPRARSVRLGDLLNRLPRGERGVPAVPLEVRQGNPIEEVLGAVTEHRPDLLVIGYRRGGPPKVVGPTDVARNLLYGAPSAVLTVPL